MSALEKEKALTLHAVAEILGMSYGAVFAKRKKIGFQLPGSRVWRVWPSMLAEITKPRENVVRISLRQETDTEVTPCLYAKGRNQSSGSLISSRQVESELDNLLGQVTRKRL